jgi:hypothetical protein
MDANADIKQRNKMKFLVFEELIHFLRRVCFLINSEDSLVEHVLKIRPHSIQRNVVLVVSFDYCLEVI